MGTGATLKLRLRVVAALGSAVGLEYCAWATAAAGVSVGGATASWPQPMATCACFLPEYNVGTPFLLHHWSNDSSSMC
jgi:hypothetical protein